VAACSLIVVGEARDTRPICAGSAVDDGEEVDALGADRTAELLGPCDLRSRFVVVDIEMQPFLHQGESSVGLFDLPNELFGQNGSVAADANRERLAATFDRAADLYNRARPDYPDELYDDLVAVTKLSPGADLLEVGSATGKATLPLARRGFRITCLEPGAALAAAARRNLKAFDVEVVQTRFEDWTPPPVPFAMVLAATSWHWVDPAVRFQKAADVLEPSGYLAVWGAGHVFPHGGDPFFEELQEIYDEIGEPLPPDSVLPRPQGLPDDRDEIESSGLFDVAAVRQYDWETVYDADGYIDLLNTFSGHIAMEDWQRERVYGEIRRRLSRRPDGRLRRHWGGVLQVARRRQ
jgi:SAM-dependent methyltransferase